jgi:hypothetical protein
VQKGGAGSDRSICQLLFFLQVARRLQALALNLCDDRFATCTGR